jgi:hypothetical protein
VLIYGIVQNVTGDHLLFGFSFRGGRGRALRDLEEFDVAASDADFMWVHLDLRDVAAQAWLRGRPWPPDVIETVAAPIQRGRLFTTPDIIYGHLREFRDEPGAATLQLGSLCVAASHRLIVTGRRLPLLSIEEVRRQVDAGTALPASPFGLITEFFEGRCYVIEATTRSGIAVRNFKRSQRPRATWSSPRREARGAFEVI